MVSVSLIYFSVFLNRSVDLASEEDPTPPPMYLSAGKKSHSKSPTLSQPLIGF